MVFKVNFDYLLTTIIYRTINSSNDHTVLQHDFDTLTNLAKTWQMEFNVHKCNILQISHIHDKSTFPYTTYSTPLKYVTEHKYLRVWLNSQLSWHSHISNICHKANRTLGFLQRNFKTCPTHLKEVAYKQLVLPLLEYCATIWDPHNQYDIKHLEMVQRRTARFVLNKPWSHNDNNSVTEMLQYLKWPALQIRRKYLRLILLFKIINNLLMIPNQYLPALAQLPSTRSNHPLKLFRYQPSNDTYKFSFFPRTIPDWNDLPINDIQEQSLADFKLHLTELFFFS